jgi:hypothetical protein
VGSTSRKLGDAMVTHSRWFTKSAAVCRKESVQLVEAQVASDNAPAVELFTTAKFELHARLLTFRRTLKP